MALKLVIMLAQENGVFQIQIYGDSLLLVQWMGREFNFSNSHCNLFFMTFTYKIILLLHLFYPSLHGHEI
jgi:hypothetical protein